jgi:hypothetical protein
MVEDQLSQKIEDVYEIVESLKKEKGMVFDLQLERLSYLVIAAGSHSAGSNRLDAIFSRIQKESPTLVVPRFVMSPAELGRFIDDLALNDPDDLVYSAYRLKVLTISEVIAKAKNAITQRCGFMFDPSAQIIRTQ